MKKDLFTMYSQLSDKQQIIAEILMFAYLSDKNKKINVSKCMVINLDGDKKVVYQIEVKE